MGLIVTLRKALRDTAKATAFPVLGSGPRLRQRLERVRQTGVTTILNLHRVAPPDSSSYPPLEPELFDELLGFVGREFSVVTFAEIVEPTPRPKLVLSFDDGYRDFVTHALPMLKKHGFRANQNIIPKCVESGLPPLNVMAQDFIGKAPPELVARLYVTGFSGSRGPSFGTELSHFLKMRPQIEQDHLAHELLPQFFAWDRFEPTAMMTAQDVTSASDHEFGAHSWAHASMEFETDDYLDEDVRRCASWFESRLGLPMTIYAFPNGSARSGQAERVLAHGIEHVLLVGEAFDDGDRVHKRFTFDGRSPAEVRFRALGGLARV